MANDPEALSRIALKGLGVAVIAVPYVLPHLKSGALQRVLPDWYSEQRAISPYFTRPPHSHSMVAGGLPEMS